MNDTVIDSEELRVLKEKAKNFDELSEICESVLYIVNETLGVDGYHMNGQVALWSEFPEITRMEEFINKNK